MNIFFRLELAYSCSSLLDSRSARLHSSHVQRHMCCPADSGLVVEAIAGAKCASTFDMVAQLNRMKPHMPSALLIARCSLTWAVHSTDRFRFELDCWPEGLNPDQFILSLSLMSSN